MPKSNIEKIKVTCNIVACTANTSSDWQKAVKNSGMLKMINKPMGPKDVKFILDKWFFTIGELNHIDNLQAKDYQKD